MLASALLLYVWISCRAGCGKLSLSHGIRTNKLRFVGLYSMLAQYTSTGQMSQARNLYDA
jgi:hypothetical protein